MFAAHLRHSGLNRAEGAERDGDQLRLVASRSSTVDGIVRISRDRALSANMKDKDDEADKDRADKDKADRVP